MMRNLLILTMFAGLAIRVNTANADDDHIQARRLVEAGLIQPLEAIIESVKKHHTGRILEVAFDQENGHYIYEIELLDSAGVVRKMELDAVTRELIKTAPSSP